MSTHSCRYIHMCSFAFAPEGFWWSFLTSDWYTSKEAENLSYKAMRHKYLHLQYLRTWISAHKEALHYSSHTFQSLQHKHS